MKKITSIVLSVLLIVSLMMCGAVSTNAATYSEGDMVIYEYVATCDKMVEAFEGAISYPVDDVYVETPSDICIYDGRTGSIAANDDGNGQILFNASSATDVYDFTGEGNTLAFVVFYVKSSNFDPSSISTDISNFYDTEHFNNGGNNVFSFKSIVDDEVIASGEVDLDQPETTEATEATTESTEVTTEPTESEEETTEVTEATESTTESVEETTEVTEATENTTEDVTVATEKTEATEGTTEDVTTATESVEVTEATESTPPAVLPTEAPNVVAPDGHVYTLAGMDGLCGDNWTPASTANDMVVLDDGRTQKVYTGIAAGTYEFKVVQDHSWDLAFGEGCEPGGPNKVITVAADNATVTITFNPATGYITYKIEAEGVEATEVTEPTTEAPTEVTEPTTEAPTEPATECGHTHTKTTKIAATYFAKGKTVVTCTDCGTVIKTTSIAKKVLKTPSVKIKAGKKSISVAIKKKVTGATGIIVKYQLKGKKAVTVKLKNKKYTKAIKKLKKGKTYSVKLRAYVKSGKKVAYSKWTTAKKVKVK